MGNQPAIGVHHLWTNPYPAWFIGFQGRLMEENIGNPWKPYNFCLLIVLVVCESMHSEIAIEECWGFIGAYACTNEIQWMQI